MTRKEFLELMGITTMLTCLGCSKNPLIIPEKRENNDFTQGQVYPGVDTTNTRKNPTYNSDFNPPPPTPKVNFTINIDQPQFSILNNLGSFTYYKGVIIAKTLQGDFIAASEYCTHNGVTLEYNGSKNRYDCPAHGSAFTSTGMVINGPAMKAIKSYKTQLTGQNLRVYED